MEGVRVLVVALENKQWEQRRGEQGWGTGVAFWTILDGWRLGPVTWMSLDLELYWFLLKTCGCFVYVSALS